VTHNVLTALGQEHFFIWLQEIHESRPIVADYARTARRGFEQTRRRRPAVGPHRLPREVRGGSARAIERDDIDTPITLVDLRLNRHTDYVRADQVPLFDVYFSFAGGPALTELEGIWGALEEQRSIAGRQCTAHRCAIGDQAAEHDTGMTCAPVCR
jgi:hypothetical protein